MIRSGRGAGGSIATTNEDNQQGGGMSRIVAAGAVVALVIVGIAAGSGAQGLVSMQKLSAPPARIVTPPTA